MAVSPATVLQIAPDVTVTYGTGVDVGISFAGDRITAGPHGVAILEAFRTPTPMGEGLKRLEVRTTGMQDWIELSAMISTFARLGILRDPAHAEPQLSAEGGRFDSARQHVLMLGDRVRTGSYLEAIRQVVRPGDVVVEIGTGTGVLSVAAAQAGAARVYAIEATVIGELARRVFERNGVADRVTLVQGLSSRVTLPERCDVLVAEIIGRDPLEEGVLEFTRDAVARFLKPGGRLIPSHLELLALPVVLPEDVVQGWTFTPEVVDDWRRHYGIDFSSLLEGSRRSLWKTSVSPRRLHQFAAVTPLISVLRHDLSQTGEVGFERTVTASVRADGMVGGVALCFAATLAPGLVLDNDPAHYHEDSSWDHLMWGLPEPVAVRAGDTLELTMRHRVDGPPVEVAVAAR